MKVDRIFVLVRYPLDALFLTYLFLMLLRSIPWIFLRGLGVRITWFFLPGVTAYPSTVVLYVAAGLVLFRELHWMAVGPLALCGTIQEVTWGLGSIVLHPSSVSAAFSGILAVYTLLVWIVAPVVLTLFFFKLVTVTVRLWAFLLVYPIIFAAYFLAGMPVFDASPPLLSTPSLIPEMAVVLSCMSTFLVGLKYSVIYLFSPSASGKK